MLEFFRVNHCHKQIDEKQQGDEAYDDCLHSNLLEFFAKADVESAYDKKQNHDPAEDQVVHTIVPVDKRRSPTAWLRFDRVASPKNHDRSPLPSS
jgi:hypothetical protein